MQAVRRILPTVVRQSTTRSTSLLLSSSSKPLTTPLYQRRTMATSATSATSATPFLDAIAKRRTFYQITNALPDGLTESKIEDIMKQIVTNVPSAFNSQSTRIVVLFQKEHEKVWTFALEILKAIVPADKFAPTEQKLTSFKGAYGTILFFEDTTAVKKLQDAFPLYQDKFPDWSQHTNAMHQFATWTALEGEGLGCSLQHYNPLIDTKVKAEWNIPNTWSLVAQMPFGKPTGKPGDKTFQPLEDRLKVYGKK